MPTDRYFRRRMAIGKFNNRPPFDVKKFDDSTSIENKEENPPTCNCKGKFANSAQKSYRNVVKYLEEIDGRYQNSMKNKNKNVIPKIIESFQRVTPKKQPRPITNKQKSDSLHTLYRNNSPSFGKNIPNHKLMKNLLQSCNSDDMSALNHESYFDVIPSRDTNASILKRSTEGGPTRRIDKKTSTTGLVWPVNSNPIDKSQVNLKTTKSIPSNKSMGRTKSRIPQMRELHTEKTCVNHKQYCCETKQNVSNTELEYYPTKDGQKLHCHKKIENIAKLTDKQNIRLINGLNKEFPQYKFKPDGPKKEQTYVLHLDKNNNTDEVVEKRKKEKSFVQVQVEKYNKINVSKNHRSKGHITNNNAKAKSIQETRKNINKNYIDLMASMKETLPNLGEQYAVDSAGGKKKVAVKGLKLPDFSENYDWSDNVAENEAEVKFPRETRNAMEDLIERSRIPLTKYTKSQNIQIQPAISIISQPKTDFGDYRKSTYKKMSQLPCPKNLLCSRGYHEGPCKIEKGPSTRYNDHRMRSKHL